MVGSAMAGFHGCAILLDHDGRTIAIQVDLTSVEHESSSGRPPRTWRGTLAGAADWAPFTGGIFTLLIEGQDAEVFIDESFPGGAVVEGMGPPPFS
jgi:hypothetical protein